MFIMVSAGLLCCLQNYWKTERGEIAARLVTKTIKGKGQLLIADTKI